MMPHEKRVERASFRAALALGFCATLGLWLYTGYAFTARITSIQQEADAIAARYTRTQELLATVRSQVLLASIRARDALLDPSPAALAQHRDAIASSARTIAVALAAYEPVAGAEDEAARLTDLRAEVDRFHAALLRVIDEAVGRTPQAIRGVLNETLVPRREAALALSEDVERLNRGAFIRQQAEIRKVHRAAELESRQRLGVALVIGLGVLLVTSLYAVRLEARLRRQMQRDARLSAELQQTAAKVLNAQEEERRSIARELHDEVGQVLTAIRVELDVAQRTIEGSGSSAVMLTEAQTITDGALQTVRSLAQLLHPAALDDLGLSAAVEAALRSLSRRAGVRGHFHQTGVPSQLSKEVELAAYRIVQEALNNVVKHARASECHVRLIHLADRLMVEIEDDGVGFVDDIDRPIIARGLGLVSVRERAARLGGTCTIVSRSGKGTKVMASLPDRDPEIKYA